MNSYKELILWQKAIELSLLIYSHTKSFPKEEAYGLTSQIRRASVSIPSNIAEGNARKYRKEYIKFLSMAYGSAAELETQLFIANKLKYLTDIDYANILSLLTEIMKMLNKTISTLRTIKP